PIEIVSCVFAFCDLFEPLRAKTKIPVRDIGRGAAVVGVRAAAIADAAKAGDAARSSGPARTLEGVPFAVKDLIAVKDMPLTLGSPPFQDHIAQKSAASVEHLTQLGGYVVGKLNLHELAFGITGDNAHFGAVGNPYDPSRIAGGSSSGSAAAVALGAATFALGTDTGGSGRIPAALCGVAGYRPTTGRYSTEGSVTLSKTRDTLALFARTARDISVLDGLLAGETPLAPRGLDGVRIGVPRKPFYEGLAPDVAEAMDAALRALEAAGVQLVEGDVSEIVELDEQCGMVIAAYETIEAFKRYTPETIGRSLAEIVPEIASADVRGIFADALENGPPEAVYREALTVTRPRLQKAYADWYARHDVEVAVFPTMPVTALPIGDNDTTEMNGEIVPVFPTLTRMTRANSVAGVPAISIPCGQDSGGLPIGLQIEAPEGADLSLLALASAVEGLFEPLPRPRLSA
ncbi:MAG: amidase family protein, partial [Pseudomonadota bacterium]